MSGDWIDFHAYGTPIPQGSKTARVMGNRAVLYDDNKLLKPWRASVVEAAVDSLGGQTGFAGPVNVHLVFTLPRPATVNRPHPSVKPDLDKLVRAIFDALTTSKVIVDDARIINLTTTKQYEGYGHVPGVYVHVQEVTA